MKIGVQNTLQKLGKRSQGYGGLLILTCEQSRIGDTGFRGKLFKISTTAKEETIL